MRVCLFIDVAMLEHAAVDEGGLRPLAGAVRALAGAGVGVSAVALTDGALAPALTSELKTAGARVVVIAPEDEAPADLVRRVRANLPAFIDGLLTGPDDRLVDSIAFELRARATARDASADRTSHYVFTTGDLCAIVQAIDEGPA